MKEWRRLEFKKISLGKFCRWMMAALYIILPIYFSLEISDSLPSFTGSRMIIIISFLALLVLGGKIAVPRSKTMRMVWFLVISLLLVNLLHIPDSSSYSLKAIFSLLLENLMLICIIIALLNSQQNINRFINVMVCTSAIVVFFALIEFFTGYNVFYLLTTTNRTVYQASYIRLGMTRAEASFGHSVYFGVYCSCMLPFVLFLFEKSSKCKYLLIALLNVVGVLISGSRGQMVACFATCFLIYLKKKGTMRKKYTMAIVTLVTVGVIMMAFVPAAFSYVWENIKSILNILGFNFTISSDYGINLSGLDSRTVQLSGIRWLIENGSFLFGLGSLAPSRGLVSYYWASYGWQTVKSIDVGYVGWFLEYGLVGAIIFFVFFAFFLAHSFKKSNEMDKNCLYNPIKWFFVCYIFNLLSSTGLDKMLWIVIGILMSYEHVNRNCAIE